MLVFKPFDTCGNLTCPIIFQFCVLVFTGKFSASQRITHCKVRLDAVVCSIPQHSTISINVGGSFYPAELFCVLGGGSMKTLQGQNGPSSEMLNFDKDRKKIDNIESFSENSTKIDG